MPLSLPGANVISGGLGLIGGLFGSSSASKAAKYAANKQYQAVQETNAMNYKIAQESNQLNQQIFHEANDFNRSERLATQEYNSAAQQRARLEAAGLNPYLMMSGGSAGTAQNASSAAPPSAVTPTMQAPDMSALANDTGILGTISSGITGAANMLQQISQIQNINANTDKTKVETQGQLTQNDILKSQSIQAEIDAVVDQITMFYKIKERQQLVESMEKSIQGLDLDNKTKQKTLDWIDKEKKATIDHLKAAIDNLDANTHTTNVMRPLLQKESQMRTNTGYRNARVNERNAASNERNAATNAENALTNSYDVYFNKSHLANSQVDNLDENTRGKRIDNNHNEESWSYRLARIKIDSVPHTFYEKVKLYRENGTFEKLDGLQQLGYGIIEACHELGISTKNALELAKYLYK